MSNLKVSVSRTTLSKTSMKYSRLGISSSCESKVVGRFANSIIMLFSSFSSSYVNVLFSHLGGPEDPLELSRILTKSASNRIHDSNASIFEVLFLLSRPILYTPLMFICLACSIEPISAFAIFCLIDCNTDELSLLLNKIIDLNHDILCMNHDMIDKNQRFVS